MTEKIELAVNVYRLMEYLQRVGIQTIHVNFGDIKYQNNIIVSNEIFREAFPDVPCDEFGWAKVEVEGIKISSYFIEADRELHGVEG